MEKNVIITISRQFGSNGREIARKLAEYLDISYYNKEILERIAVNMAFVQISLKTRIKMRMDYLQ